MNATKLGCVGQETCLPSSMILCAFGGKAKEIASKPSGELRLAKFHTHYFYIKPESDFDF